MHGVEYLEESKIQTARELDLAGPEDAAAVLGGEDADAWTHRVRSCSLFECSRVHSRYTGVRSRACPAPWSMRYFVAVPWCSVVPLSAFEKNILITRGVWVDGAEVWEAKKKGSFCLPFVGAKDAGQPGCCGEGSKARWPGKK